MKAVEHFTTSSLKESIHIYSERDRRGKNDKKDREMKLETKKEG